MLSDSMQFSFSEIDKYFSHFGFQLHYNYNLICLFFVILKIIYKFFIPSPIKNAHMPILQSKLYVQQANKYSNSKQSILIFYLRSFMPCDVHLTNVRLIHGNYVDCLQFKNEMKILWSKTKRLTEKKKLKKKTNLRKADTVKSHRRKMMEKLGTHRASGWVI